VRCSFVRRCATIVVVDDEPIGETRRNRRTRADIVQPDLVGVSRTVPLHKPVQSVSFPSIVDQFYSDLARQDELRQGFVRRRARTRHCVSRLVHDRRHLSATRQRRDAVRLGMDTRAPFCIAFICLSIGREQQREHIERERNNAK
jgi:hypothetical protein